MANKKIPELTQAIDIDDSDLLLLETANGTESITYKNLRKPIDTDPDHTHSTDDIIGFPTTLKNPNALTIQMNGIEQTVYDGSSEKTVDITAANIGAADEKHTHSEYSTATNVTNGTSEGSVAEGINATALGNWSHAEGGKTKTNGNYSHAEGYQTIAGGEYTAIAAHAEGWGTIANKTASHAEGNATEASGDYSHAEGCVTEASGDYSHAEGYETIASGSSSHAEGNATEASGNYSHAGGYGTIASGDYSHAEGCGTDASGLSSHAEGNGAIASGNYSHAEGYGTIASGHAQTAIGLYNKSQGSINTVSSSDPMFIVGNGKDINTRSNAFKVTYGNQVYIGSGGSYNSSGADYGEYWEWLDGNPDVEDRIGHFVTLDGDKIKIAEPSDEILGAISATACVIGNSDEDYRYRFRTDNFGRIQCQTVKEAITELQKVENKDGTIVFNKIETGEYREIEAPIIDDNYDPSLEYIPRSKRPEWDVVGMFGQLIVWDDGSCEVNKFCKVANGGIATASNDASGYRVLKRIDDNIVKILFRH